MRRTKFSLWVRCARPLNDCCVFTPCVPPTRYSWAAAVRAADYQPQAWEFVCLDTRLATAAKRERLGKQLKPFEKFTFIIATNHSNIGSFLNVLIPPAMLASNAPSALPVAPPMASTQTCPRWK